MANWPCMHMHDMAAMEDDLLAGRVSSPRVTTPRPRLPSYVPYAAEDTVRMLCTSSCWLLCTQFLCRFSNGGAYAV